MREVIEDLMKPRIKVINDFWDNPFKVGDIIQFEYYGPYYDFITDKELGKDWITEFMEHPVEPYSKQYSLRDFTLFPHLFRKLEWWQDRKPEEMPKYYKLPGNGKILKTSFRVEKNSGVVMLDFKPTETVPTALMYTLPATETDYLNYINSKP